MNWAILGTGVVAKQFSQALLACDQLIVAVGSQTSEQKANDFIISNHFVNCIPFGNYEEMLSSPKVRIDIVYIATPHSVHYEHVMLCLKHKKHVLCEKAFCVNAKQAREMIQCAKDNKLFLMEGMWTRFFPNMFQIRQWISEGKIGQVCAMQGNMGFFGDLSQTEHRLLRHECAGGSLLDLGVYLLYMASMAVQGQKPVSILSKMTFLESTRVDEQCSMIIEYPNNTIATLHCCIKTKLSRHFQISGTKGYIRIADPFHRPQEVYLCTTKEPLVGQARMGENPEEKFTFESVNTLPGLGMHYQVQHVVQCIKDGLLDSPIVPLNETLQIMEVMDEIRRQNHFVYDFEKK